MAGYIGVQPVPKATQRREYFTATSNQTTFNTSGYTPDYVDVYMNGVKLSPADFTATNGSDVVLASGAATGDLLQIISFLPFQAANQAFTGTFSVTGAVDFDSTLTTNGNITINTGNSGVPAINLSHSNANADNFQLTAGIPGVANSGFSIRDVDESTNRLVIDTSGNVGIAMTPDSAVKLSVSGAIGPTNGSNSAPTHTFYSDPDTGMYRSGANSLSFTTGGSNALTINSSQNATFAGTITGGSSITATTTVNVGTGGGFYLKQDSSESTIRSESQPIVLQTFASSAWNDRLIIANNGNVGIGCTPESAIKLEVNAGSDGAVAISGRSDGGNGNNRRFNLIPFADGGGANYGGGLKIQTRDSVNVFHNRMIIDSGGCTTIQTGTSNVADEFIFAKFYCSVSPGNAAGILLGGYPADGYAKQGIFIDRYAGFPGNSGRGDLLLVNKDSTNTDTPTSADAKVKIEPTGNVTVMDGDLVIGASGHGISFAATTDATGMSNELFDDYEEGTWTPEFIHQANNGTNNPTITYDGQNGIYTKIGNMVYATFHLGTDSVTHNNGGQSLGLGIRGLPFTTASTDARGSIIIGFRYSWGTNTPGQGSVFSNNTVVNLWRLDDAGNNILTTDLGTGANQNRINGTIVYRVA